MRTKIISLTFSISRRHSRRKIKKAKLRDANNNLN